MRTGMREGSTEEEFLSHSPCRRQDGLTARQTETVGEPAVTQQFCYRPWKTQELKDNSWKYKWQERIQVMKKG